jgi:drug/metabolite transporter (DMT)-like permease
MLYLSARLGLTCISLLKSWFNGKPTLALILDKRDWGWFIGVVLVGGIFAPLCLMKAMSMARASSVSLLFNLEIVFAVLIARFIFKEHISLRATTGLIAILLGGICLAWNSDVTISLSSLFLMSLACLFWAINTNFTCQMKHSDPVLIAKLRGLIAGTFNLSLALILGQSLPAAGVIGYATTVGLVSYGIGLSLYIAALHKMGAAKTTALSATEPFMGALLSVIILQEPITINLVLATVLMGLGVGLHLPKAKEQLST